METVTEDMRCKLLKVLQWIIQILKNTFKQQSYDISQVTQGLNTEP